ncbi:MAG: MATE family efflux transporter, partial [Butyrivibrio sp.]|nr:MATE family efflux transporter [Butyrivibrio sp.]
MDKTMIDSKAFYKNLITIALPIALQSLMLALVAACDALMLGRVAQIQMTAVSLATQIQFVQNMFLSSATAAGAILGAQYWGKGDKKALENIFNIMLLFCGIVSVLFFLACEFSPQVLMGIFAADKDLIRIGSDYLRIAGWSYLITGVSQCYLTIMKVTERVKAGAAISSAAVVINIIFNA